MKRALLAILATGLVVPAVAYAATVTCTGGECRGTREADSITSAPTADDLIYAKPGNDTITEAHTNEQCSPDTSNPGSYVCSNPSQDIVYGGRGNDTINYDTSLCDANRIYGDDGDDVIDVREGTVTTFLIFPAKCIGGGDTDVVDCGKGRDRVHADRTDNVQRDCEKVTRD